MTKRDKFPPLKPHQKDIVQKHAYRKWLKENGTPYDKSKYEFIQKYSLRETDFDEHKERLESFLDFKVMMLKYAVLNAWDVIKEKLTHRRTHNEPTTTI